MTDYIKAKHSNKKFKKSGRFLLSLFLMTTLIFSATPQTSAFAASAKVEGKPSGSAEFNVLAGNPTTGYTNAQNDPGVISPHPTAPTLDQSAKVGYAGHEWVVVGYDGNGVAGDDNAGAVTLFLSKADYAGNSTTRNTTIDPATMKGNNAYSGSALCTAFTGLLGASAGSFINTADPLLAKETNAALLKPRQLKGGSGIPRSSAMVPTISATDMFSDVANGIDNVNRYQVKNQVSEDTTFDWFAYDYYRKNIYPSTTGGYAYTADPEYHPDRVAGPDVDNQKLWPLSFAEASLIDPSVRAYGSSSNGSYYLRSPGGYRSSNPDAKFNSMCNYKGSVSGTAETKADYVWIRPALNLNLTNVELTSAVAGGKDVATVESGFADIAPRTAGEKIKFTMVDPTGQQTLAPVKMLSAAFLKSTDPLKFDYSGATTGADRYVSAVLRDKSGNVVTYAKLADTSSLASGTVSASLAGVADGYYTLEIFSEQINGENNTDFCSAIQTFAIAIGIEPPPVPDAALAVSSIKASQKTVYVVKGKTAKLPYIIDASASGKVPVAWIASKKAVASVGSLRQASGSLKPLTNQNQNLTIKAGKKLGSSKITLTSGGKKLVLTVKVVKRAKAVAKSSVKIKGLPKTLKVGASKTLKAAFTKNATAIVTWKSSKPSVVKIDASGKITALKKGTATITLKMGGKSKKVAVYAI